MRGKGNEMGGVKEGRRRGERRGKVMWWEAWRRGGQGRKGR